MQPLSSKPKEAFGVAVEAMLPLVTAVVTWLTSRLGEALTRSV